MSCERNELSFLLPLISLAPMGCDWDVVLIQRQRQEISIFGKYTALSEEFILASINANQTTGVVRVRTGVLGLVMWPSRRARRLGVECVNSTMLKLVSSPVLELEAPVNQTLSSA